MPFEWYVEFTCVHRTALSTGEALFGVLPWRY